MQPEKVATPAFAVLVWPPVQLRVAPLAPVPVAIARLTVAVLVVTVLPYASWIETAGCVANTVLYGDVDGWVVKTSLEAAAALTVIGFVVAFVTPVAVAVR